MNDKEKLAIMNQIRLLFMRGQRAKEVYERFVDPIIKGERGGKRYQCKSCGMAFPISEVQVDHIYPIVPFGMKKLDMTLDHFGDNVFCHKSNLQILCKSCHHAKSVSENAKR